MIDPGTITVSIHKYLSNQPSSKTGSATKNPIEIWNESIAVEAPLKIYLQFQDPAHIHQETFCVIMRTPGRDEDLVTGLLLTEGIIHSPVDIQKIDIQKTDLRSLENEQPSLLVTLASHVPYPAEGFQRQGYMNSSCGLCGKKELKKMEPPSPSLKNSLALSVETICRLPDILRKEQRLFNATGSIHGAALVSLSGELKLVREDVGRHNAVDKVIGAALLQKMLPLNQWILTLSGRASFELIQKTIVASIPIVVSVGAPSSAAIKLARQFDLTLIGFVKTSKFNVYHGLSRIL